MVESVTKGGQKQPFSRNKINIFLSQYPYQFLNMPFSRYLFHFFHSRKTLFFLFFFKKFLRRIPGKQLGKKGIDFFIILAGILFFSFLELGFCFEDFRCNLLVTFPLGSLPFLPAWGRFFFFIFFFYCLFEWILSH